MRHLQPSDQGNSNEEYTPEPNATAPSIPVRKDEPVATKPKVSGNKGSTIQVKKFHSFKSGTPEKPTTIEFNVFLYFFGRPIVQKVYFRLKIVYGGRLRNLQDGGNVEAEKTPSECEIINKELIGKIGSGDNVDYNCEAQTRKNATEVTNVTIDTDTPLQADNETISFQEVSFDEKAAEESANLMEAKAIVNEPITLQNTTMEEPVPKDYFRIKGQVANKQQSDKLVNLSPFNLYISNPQDMSAKNQFECSAEKVDDTNVIITCKNPNNYPITSDIQIHNAQNEEDSKDPIYISMLNPTNTDPYQQASSNNNISYRKNSSGLSGGAIAGIVIACAVVLIAASIVAMMLRKPTPPLDNTTVVGLKTVDNY